MSEPSITYVLDEDSDYYVYSSSNSFEYCDDCSAQDLDITSNISDSNISDSADEFNMSNISDSTGEFIVGGISDSTAIMVMDLDIDSDHTTINSVPLNDYIRKEIDMNLYSPMNILIITLICLVVCKFIAPKLTIKWAARRFKNLILMPFRRFKKEVTEELKDD